MRKTAGLTDFQNESKWTARMGLVIQNIETAAPLTGPCVQFQGNTEPVPLRCQGLTATIVHGYYYQRINQSKTSAQSSVLPLWKQHWRGTVTE